MGKERFIYLLDKYVSGGILPAENDEFFDLLATGEYDDLLGSKMLVELREDNGSQSVIPPHVSQEIIMNILAAEKNATGLLPANREIFPLTRWVAAACIILLSVSGIYLFTHSAKTSGAPSVTLAAIIPHDILYRKNETSAPLVLTLPDSSKVTLQPQSILHYAPAFDKDKRAVYLEGEAFFQVKKNPSKPFLVYYNNIVTRVLGTSFTEGVNPRSGNIEVSVQTGRVQVFENEQLVRKSEFNTAAVIVTPNQKAIYKMGEKEFETALVDNPLPLLNSQLDTTDQKYKSQFIYDRSKISMILQQLKKYYGIDILVENENLDNCLFTGDLSAQDLYTKLKILTLTINASYEINGTKILIKGEGCN